MGDIFDTIGAKGQKADIFDTLDVKGDIFDQAAPPEAFVPAGEPMVQYPSDPYERQPAVVPPSEIVKAGKRGLYGVGEQIGEVAGYLGKEVEASQVASEADLVELPEGMRDIARPPIRLDPEAIKEIGATTAEYWKKGKEKPELQMSPELAQQPWHDPKKFVVLMSEAMPLTIAGMGSGMATTAISKSPALGATVTGMFFGGISAAATMKEMEKAGIPQEEALMWSRLAGVGEGAIEFLPSMMFLKLLKGKKAIPTEALKEGVTTLEKSLEVAKSMGKLGLAEGIEEGLQATKDNLIAQQTYDIERETLKDVPESAALGGAMGLLLGAGGKIAGDMRQPPVKTSEKPSVEVAKKEVVEEVVPRGTKPKVVENGHKEKQAFRATAEAKAKKELLKVEREAQEPERLTRESVGEEEIAIKSNIAKLTKPQEVTLDQIQYEVENGEQGSRRKGFVVASTFPPYFQNKGYTKKETLRAIDKVKSGEELGVRQATIIEDLVLSARMEEAIETERIAPAKESVVTDEVAEHIGDVTPTIGLAIKKTAGKEDIKLRNIINKKKKKFAFPDKETEKRFSDSRGLTKETAISKTREFLGNLKNRFTRTFEHLPRTGEFARLQFDILKLQKQKGVASDKTLRNIQNITIKLDNMEYDLFGRKVILDDLVETAEKGKDLPFGFTTETLAKSKTLLEKELEKTPRVSDAVVKRTKIWNDIKEQYVPAMKDIGVDVSERLQNKNYFRHQVLEYASLKSSVKGTPLKKPKHRGFLKQRKGSLLDINTDYIQAEHEVMAQMLYDIEVAKTMKTITDKYDISKTVRKDAKEQGIADWREAVPEGYAIWQPDKGNTFFMADSIPSSLASKLENGALKELGLKKEDIKKVMAVGGKQQELVVKEEVAKTLEDLEKTSKEAGIVKLDREIHRRWKMWVLVSPRRWFKYNFRNITGDGDALFVGNPAALKKVPQAISELYKTMFHDKPMTKNLRDWFERGGINSTLQAQEMGELNQLKIFVDIHNKEQSGKSTIPMKIWKGYWKAARLTTDFREAIFRYAAFLDYIQQIESSKDGKPKNFGASKPEEIMALEDTKDKAYWLQNDLLGAYDRVSVTGQNLASFWYPFWRWKEVNFRRYTQFIKNAVNDKKVAETVGRKVLFGTVVKSPLIAIRVGKFVIKATAFWSMIQAWNILMFPDEEDELSNEEKSRLHIIFGRDKDGKIIYFTRLGALGDFLAWFGLDGAPGLVSDYLNNRRTMKETAIEMAKSPVNAIAQGATPLIKTPLELTTGKSLFPDVTSPRAVRDKGLHFARSFGLAAEYKALAGLPSRPYKESLDNILAYKADPLQVAYYEILELKYRFLDKIGQGRSGSVVTPRGQALYNLKLAVRYEDKEAFEKYFSVYASYGGTPEDLAKALERLHPLTGLRRRKKGKIILAPEGLAFLSTLSKKDQEKLVKAEKFYNTVLQGQNQKGE